MSDTLKLHTADAILLWPDGHHSFRQVIHSGDLPPVLMEELTYDWPATEMFHEVKFEEFYLLGKATSKLTISGQGYQRKTCVWFYGPKNPAGMFRLDALADLAEEFFVTKRTTLCRKLLHF